MNKTNLKKQNGITLEVLIITVIILIILAVVTIETLDDDKLTNSARELVDQSEQQIEEHQQMTNEVRDLYK